MAAFCISLPNFQHLAHGTLFAHLRLVKMIVSSEMPMKSLSILRWFVLFVWLAVVAAFLTAPRADADGQAQELATRAQALLKARCYACHGANGVARKNVFVLDRARLLASK